MIKMLESHKSKDFDKNPIKDKQENKNQYQDFENLNVTIRLPQIILTATDNITIITNLPRDELYNEFIVNELDSFSYDIDSLFRFILKRSGLLEKLRIGINQYYGKERHEKKQKRKKCKNINKHHEIIDIAINLPKRIINFINIICEISNIQKENLFSFLIIARLEYIYSDPEVLYDYINDEGGIYEDLREGINCYYGKSIY